MGSSSNTEEPAPGQLPRKKDVCPICKGAGYLTRNVPPGHPDFHALIPCRCRQDQMAQRRKEELWGLSNLGELSRKTFANFLPEGTGLPPEKRRNLRMAYEAAREFAQNPQGWLILKGGFGCGKTHLAAAIANECIERGQPVLFIVVPDLLDYLRAAFGPDSDISFDERFEAVRSAPVLILDDLGTQATSPWAQEKLYQIINYRYNARLPTVITSNCELEDLDPRIRSRMMDTDLARVAGIAAGDFRGAGPFGTDGAQNELNSLGQVEEMTFDRLSLRENELTREERENLRRAIEAARDFAQNPKGWLVFTGDHGCGKTHLAAAIANWRHINGQPVIFVTVPDLLDYLRAAYSPSSTTSFDKRFEDVRRAPLLILDDLGTESGTPWAREKLYQIINYRYNLRLPTVITTAAPLEKVEPRLRSRLIVTERYTVFALLVPPYCGPAPAEQFQKRRPAKPREM